MYILLVWLNFYSNVICTFPKCYDLHVIRGKSIITFRMNTRLLLLPLSSFKKPNNTQPILIFALLISQKLTKECSTEIAREGSPTARACVVRILSIWCTGAGEQEALCAAGACEAAAALLAATPPAAPALPALDLLAAMCFENTSVSQIALNTR